MGLMKLTKDFILGAKMLTEKEVDIVINRLEEYPVGISSQSWGYGPMALTFNNSFGLPKYQKASVFTLEQLKECG